jgi:ABC-type transport system involved in multi-copper enzyme maturation permease subunit
VDLGIRRDGRPTGAPGGEAGLTATILAAPGPTVLPGRADQAWTALRYEVRLHLRSGRLHALWGVAGALGFSALGLVLLRGPGNEAVGQFVQLWLSFLPSYLATLLAVGFAGDIAARDLGSEGGLYTLPLPIDRSSLLWGRIAGNLLLATAALVLFTTGIGLGAYAGYRTLPLGAMATSFGIAVLLELAAITVVAFLSVAFRKPVWGFIAPVVVLILGLNAAAAILYSYDNLPLWWSLPYSANVVLLPWGPEGTALLPSYPVGLASILGYIGLFGTLATTTFATREVAP